MSKSRNTRIELIRKQKKLARNSLVVGVLLLAVGGYVFMQARQFYTSAKRATGKIVELERQQSGKDVSCFPVFSFVDQAGETHVIRTRSTRTWSQPLNRYAVGDTVEVLYPADDPESARLNNVRAVWGWPMILGGGGLLAVIAGIVLWHGAVTWPGEQPSSRKEGWAELG